MKASPSKSAKKRAPARATGPFRVGRSRTGLGLFATEAIPRGAFIAEYVGLMLNTTQAEEREKSRYCRYLFEVNKRWTIDGAPRWNVARYINHACRPNAEPFIRDRRIKIRAKRLIKPGEEITYHYGRDYIDVFFGKSGCRCDTCIAKRKATRAAKRATAKRAKTRSANGKHLNGKGRRR